MSEASDRHHLNPPELYIGHARCEPIVPTYESQESFKRRMLWSVTEATQEAVEANRELFRVLQRRAERRRDAMAAGATVAEIQAAVRAGHEEGNRQ